MFAALGNQVVALHRFKVGNIELDDRLLEGDYRPLSEQEVNSIA
jgi:16S rRNA pseudouridine516 synthase